MLTDVLGLQYIYYAELMIGSILLSWGLLSLKKRRLVENIPTSKVRSAAMGLVELRGFAQPFNKEMISPVSRRPCCWWHCVLESSGSRSLSLFKKEISSPELFYLQDSTGKVLIDAFGAELHIDENIFDSYFDGSEKIGSALQAMGVETTGLFGVYGPVRIREKVILPSRPLFIIGEPTYRKNHLESRKQNYLKRLRALKRDPAMMKEADTNKDGFVDPMEWDAFRLKKEKQFLKEETAREATVVASDRLVVRAPSHRAFIISTTSEKAVRGQLKIWSVLFSLGGVSLSGFAAWQALRLGVTISYTLMVGLVTLGLLLGSLIAKGKLRMSKIWEALS